jgi:hypothetical protein
LPPGSQDDLLAPPSSMKKVFGVLPEDDDDLAFQTQMQFQTLTNKPIMIPIKLEKGMQFELLTN